MAVRVMHIIGGGEIGGAEVHILDLATALDPLEFQVQVCTLFAAPFVQKVKEAGLEGHAVVMRNKFDFTVLWKLARLIREQSPDIVHTHGVRANLMGRLAAKMAGVPHVVTTVHSVLAQDYPDYISRQVNILAERLTASLTDQFIAVAEPLRKELGALGVAAERVAVIPNGVDVKRFAPLDSQEPRVARVREILAIPAEAPVVGMIARFHPVKGHRILVEAAKEIVKARPETRFLLVGDGFYRPVIEKQVAELGLKDKVIFAGFVEDVQAVMATMNLVVVPSLSEGFGLTATEAMAMKKAVIASKVGGLQEIIVHGKNGYHVPPGDSLGLAVAIQQLLDDPALVGRLAETGYQMVHDRYTVERMAGETAALYRRLMTTPPAASGERSS